MYRTMNNEFSTRVLYKNQVVVGEIIRAKDGYEAIDYRSVSQFFTFKPLAVGWIISRAKRRRSREKVNGSGQPERLVFST